MPWTNGSQRHFVLLLEEIKMSTGTASAAIATAAHGNRSAVHVHVELLSP